MIERVRVLLADPKNERISATEVHRRAREWGYLGGRTQLTELFKKLRPSRRDEPVVRFEGLPGEYAQFDFGGGRDQLHCDWQGARRVLQRAPQVLPIHAR